MSEIQELREFGGALVISAGAYSASDVVGGLQTYRINAPGGWAQLKAVRIADDDNEKAACKLFLFNAAPTAIADNGAFAPVIADLKALVAVVAIGTADFVTVNSNAYAIKDGLSLTLPLPSGVLYGYLVCDATPTYTATTDLTLYLDVLVP